MAWNNLSQPYLAKGQELIIFQISNNLNVEVEELPVRYHEIENPKLKEKTILSNSTKRKSVDKSVNIEMRVGGEINSDQRKYYIRGEDYIFHTIRRNESILDIVENFPGISIQDILRLNELKENDFPSVGTRLKIKRR
jgi:LysM repeat protein